MDGLQVAFVGLLGVITGILANSFWNWIERKERFKVMTFGKRLEAHQSAFYWNQTIHHSLSSHDADRIRRCISEAQEWWNSSCLFLDEKSQKSWIAVLNSGNRFSRNVERPGSDPKAERIWHDLDNNLRDIVRGIGAAHLHRQQKGSIHDMPASSGDHEKGIRHRILAKLGVNRWLVPYIIVLLMALGLIIRMVYQIPLNDSPTPFNETTRLTYILYSSASIAGLIAAIWVTASKWVKGFLMLAIYVFLAGMVINLVSFIIG